MRGTSAEAEQRPAQSERLSQLSESLPEWRIRRSGGGAERFVAPFVTLRRSRTQDAARVEQLRGHTAKTHRNLLDTDERIFEIFAEVCRRRCPSGRRPQASQRLADFRKTYRRDNSTGAAGTSLSGGWRLWSEAEPACLEVAASHLNDPRVWERCGVDFTRGGRGRSFGSRGKGGGGMSAIMAVLFFQKKNCSPRICPTKHAMNLGHEMEKP